MVLRVILVAVPGLQAGGAGTPRAGGQLDHHVGQRGSPSAVGRQLAAGDEHRAGRRVWAYSSAARTNGVTPEAAMQITASLGRPPAAQPLLGLAGAVLGALDRVGQGRVARRR
jgi:hypothetical protein